MNYLFYLFYFLQRGSEKIAIELIKILYNNAPQGSINVNHQNKQQMTALHFASQSGFGSIVEMLLDKDAEFEVKNEEGKMPIQLSTNPMCERLLQVMTISKCSQNIVILLSQRFTYFFAP